MIKIWVIIKNDVFIELGKIDVEEKKKISLTLFQVMTYLELFKNTKAEVHLNTDNILDYFKIRRNTRSVESIKKSFQFLVKNDFVYVEDNIGFEHLPKTSFKVDLLYDERFFRKHNDVKMKYFIETIEQNSEKYIVGLIYYYILSLIQYNGKTNQYLGEKKISYIQISKVFGIKSMNTVAKYIKFLEDHGFLKSRKTSEDDSVKTHKIYKVP